MALERDTHRRRLRTPHFERNVPNDLVSKTNLLGTQEQVRDCLRAYQKAGVNTITVFPEGETLDELLATLDQLFKLVDEGNAEAFRSS